MSLNLNTLRRAAIDPKNATTMHTYECVKALQRIGHAHYEGEAKYVFDVYFKELTGLYKRALIASLNKEASTYRLAPDRLFNAVSLAALAS